MVGGKLGVVRPIPRVEGFPLGSVRGQDLLVDGLPVLPDTHGELKGRNTKSVWKWIR